MIEKIFSIIIMSSYRVTDDGKHLKPAVKANLTRHFKNFERYSIRNRDILWRRVIDGKNGGGSMFVVDSPNHSYMVNYVLKRSGMEQQTRVILDDLLRFMDKYYPNYVDLSEYSHSSGNDDDKSSTTSSFDSYTSRISSDSDTEKPSSDELRSAVKARLTRQFKNFKTLSERNRNILWKRVIDNGNGGGCMFKNGDPNNLYMTKYVLLRPGFEHLTKLFAEDMRRYMDLYHP